MTHSSEGIEGNEQDLPVGGIEQDLLLLIAHQGAIPLDQLARFPIGAPAGAPAPALGDVEAAKAVDRLAAAGLVIRQDILADEPPWIWLTRSGTKASETGLCHFVPTPGALARLRATNEVRLHLAAKAPHARWTSYRVLRRTGFHGAAAPLPRAAIEIDGERHAIEVRVNARNMPYFREMVENRLAEYDAVIVFCRPGNRTAHERLVRRHGWRQVIVRNIPSGEGQ